MRSGKRMKARSCTVSTLGAGPRHQEWLPGRNMTSTGLRRTRRGRRQEYQGRRRVSVLSPQPGGNGPARSCGEKSVIDHRSRRRPRAKPRASRTGRQPANLCPRANSRFAGSIQVVDVFNRNKGAFQNGKYDTASVAGTNLLSSLDAELQAYGELLMRGKKGSIVAIEPGTGEIDRYYTAP